MRAWWLILLLEFYAIHCIKVSRGNYRLGISQTLSNIQYSNPKLEPEAAMDLSNQELDFIEQHAFDNQAHLTSLNIENNNLEELPRGVFSGLTNLTKLSLAGNRISNFYEYFKGLPNLKTLDLSRNHIGFLDKALFKDLPKFTDVIVNKNPIERIFVSIDEPVNEEKYLKRWANANFYNEWCLDTFRDKLSQLFIGRIHRTKNGQVEALYEGNSTDPFHINVTSNSLSLDLKNYELRSFKRGWFKLENNRLELLILAKNSITTVTADLLNDLPIKYVDLRNNAIQGIEKFHNNALKKLNLDYNNISSIDAHVFENTNLSTITLGHNNLDDLDFAETLPQSLQEFIIESNKISYISVRALRKLKVLKHLIISSNYIRNLESRPFDGLRELKLLDLSYNLLEYIPLGLFKDQEKLVILKLRNNYINELTGETFKNLKMLQTLELANNKIKRIASDTFEVMKNSVMKKISLINNNIERIEAGSFSNMTIDDLFLSSNKLSENSIAKGAFESCSLRYLELGHNLFNDFNGEPFYGITVLNIFSIRRNNIKSLKKGAFRYLGGIRKLDLRHTRLGRIESGSLYGFGFDVFSMIMISRLEVIEAGAFDDIS